MNKENSLLYSHPLADDDDDDEEDKDNIYNKNSNYNKLNLENNSNTGSVVNNNHNNLSKPIIPPRNKIKQQQLKTQVNMNDNNSKLNKNDLNQINVDKNNNNDDKINFCEKQYLGNLKLVNIDPLNIQPQQVRWLYKDDQAASKWLTFNGLDSLNLEIEYLLSKQNSNLKNCNKVQVLNRLFEVDILERKYVPIYWEGSPLPVMRGTWFDQSWEPLDEDISDRIELEHINKFRDHLLNKPNNEKLVNNGNNNNNNNANNETELPSYGANVQFNINNELNDMNSNSSNTGNNTNSSNNTSTASASKQQSKSVNDPIYSINIKDQTIYWYSPDDICISRSKSFMKVLSFGKQKIGVKINRGYKTNAETEDNSGDITHLVFVVHGIAQKLYEKSIIKNCDDLRKGYETMKTKFYPDVKKDIRCEFIPVDWRSSLTLDDGIVETITPQTIKFIRNKLNSSALDIMYYTSPLFRHEIMNSLSSELNRLYSLFCERNPYFKTRNCKVSVVAHSLGSVIIYDILTHNNSFITLSNTYGEDINQETKMFNHFSNNNTALLEEYLKSKKRIKEIEEKLLENNQNLTRLDFRPENLFCFGSPLAVFLALRGVRPSGSGLQDHILPKKVCKNLFNLFHPCDAVAYRLEPLVLKHYSSIMPIEVHRSSDSSSAKHVPYKEMQNKVLNKTPDFELSLQAPSSIPSVSFSFLKSKKSAELSAAGDGQENTEFSNLSNRIQNFFNSNTNANANSTHDPVDLEKRLDYQLPTSNFELISALTSHTSYWTSLDVALFMVTQLFSNDDQ